MPTTRARKAHHLAATCRGSQPGSCALTSFRIQILTGCSPGFLTGWGLPCSALAGPTARAVCAPWGASRQQVGQPCQHAGPQALGLQQLMQQLQPGCPALGPLRNCQEPLHGPCASKAR